MNERSRSELKMASASALSVFGRFNTGFGSVKKPFDVKKSRNQVGFPNPKQQFVNTTIKLFASKRMNIYILQNSFSSILLAKKIVLKK